MAKFKIGDYVGVDYQGEGYVVVPEIEVNTLEEYFTGVGVLFPHEGRYTVVPEREVHKSSRPYMYALFNPQGFDGRIVDGRVYLSLEEAEQAHKNFPEKNGFNVDLVEIEVVLPWKKRD